MIPPLITLTNTSLIISSIIIHNFSVRKKNQHLMLTLLRPPCVHRELQIMRETCTAASWSGAGRLLLGPVVERLVLYHSDQPRGDVFWGEGAEVELWYITSIVCWCDRWCWPGELPVPACQSSSTGHPRNLDCLASGSDYDYVCPLVVWWHMITVPPPQLF